MTDSLATFVVTYLVFGQIRSRNFLASDQDEARKRASDWWRSGNITELEILGVDLLRRVHFDQQQQGDNQC